MKKAIIALALFFLLCVPAFAEDGDFDGQFGINAGAYFFNNDFLDDNGFFGGVEYRADMLSIAIDYTSADSTDDPATEEIVESGSEQLLLFHLDYLYYFDAQDYETETPTYIGIGYTHRFQGDVVDDGGGFNVCLGMDWEENWNFEAKYIYFDSDDSIWGIGVGYFFN